MGCKKIKKKKKRKLKLFASSVVLMGTFNVTITGHQTKSENHRNELYIPIRFENILRFKNNMRGRWRVKRTRTVCTGRCYAQRRAKLILKVSSRDKQTIRR